MTTPGRPNGRVTTHCGDNSHSPSRSYQDERKRRLGRLQHTEFYRLRDLGREHELLEKAKLIEEAHLTSIQYDIFQHAQAATDWLKRFLAYPESKGNSFLLGGQGRTIFIGTMGQIRGNGKMGFRW